MTTRPVHQFVRRSMDPSARAAPSAVLRMVLGALEPFYSIATRTRNRLYDRGVCTIASLPRPTISVGNITSGGTGKTPIIAWLASALRGGGERVAILSRGYGSSITQPNDEQLLLDRVLNHYHLQKVIIESNPNRSAAAAAALAKEPSIGVFLLDDGFQHRRVARSLDIVLINATNPFGFNHVLPRGLLREPMSGLRRAGAFVITHADQSERLLEIEETLRRYNPQAPVYRARHAQRPPVELRSKRYFVFSAIGDPDTFERQLCDVLGPAAGARQFPDHYRYTDQDLRKLEEHARALGAQTLMTTEKDWVKIQPLKAARTIKTPIQFVQMSIEFFDGGGEPLLDQIREAIGNTVR